MSPSLPNSQPEPENAESFATLFPNFVGSWRLRRRVSNGARFVGTAQFCEADTGSLTLRETGMLRLEAGQPVQAFRDWQWLHTGPRLLEVRYPPQAGGGAYHKVVLCHRRRGKVSEWYGEASHSCGADTYQGFYRLNSRRLLICHQVNGPQKDYRMASLYIR